jgi:hypothetical protein
MGPSVTRKAGFPQAGGKDYVLARSRTMPAVLGCQAMVELEEYKFFAESTQKLTDRRQAITQTYLTVNTGIFAVVAFW